MKNKNLDSLICHEKIDIENILNIYLTDGLITDPKIFNLGNFSEIELERHSFSKAGDNHFRLWEKYFRVSNKNYFINFKLYFINAQYESNGIGVARVNAARMLNKYSSLYGQSNLIKKIQLYVDESENYGSILINETIDFRFEKKGAYHLQKKSFELTGISTDIGVSKEFTEKQINTKHAKRTKKYLPFADRKKKSSSNQALFDLTETLLRNFPNACH